jgi:hypothetical protein
LKQPHGLKRFALGSRATSHKPCWTSAMSIRAIASLWLVAALVPLVMSQIVRLEQSDPATWISWDYAGRIAALSCSAAVRVTCSRFT